MFHSDPNYLGMKLAGKIALLAIIALAITAWPLFKYYEKAAHIRGWHETSAILKSVEFYRSRYDKRTVVGGYLACKYTYVNDGKTHTGHRIALFPLGDNDKEIWAVTLKNAHDGQVSISCFVNPDDPTEAVLTTEISRLKFGLFGLIAAASLIYLIYWIVFCKPWKFQALEAE
ncbi:MAG: DUF3592 domain-containing protein [Planctomycetes bacterium]|nr:DUF3592 domain-containing protein [Planctomycetota bacterium]